MDVLIVGCGETGRRIGALHLARGAAVRGVVSSESSAARLSSIGIEPLVLDLDRSEQAPPAADLVYWLAPPPTQGSTDPRLARTLSKLPVPQRFLYMSTTAVYGERGGEWTDETTPVAPASDRGRRRLDAERQVRFWCRNHGVFNVVIRAAAIYCASRLPIERLRAGATVLSPAESGPVNRIHAADLARLCVAALERGRDDGTYDAADGVPSTTAEYYQQIAAARGLPAPRLITRAAAAAELSADAFERGMESKRIRAERIRTELGITPLSVEAWLASDSDEC